MLKCSDHNFEERIEEVSDEWLEWRYLPFGVATITFACAVWQCAWFGYVWIVELHNCTIAAPKKTSLDKKRLAIAWGTWNCCCFTFRCTGAPALGRTASAAPAMLSASYMHKPAHTLWVKSTSATPAIQPHKRLQCGDQSVLKLPVPSELYWSSVVVTGDPVCHNVSMWPVVTWVIMLLDIARPSWGSVVTLEWQCFKVMCWDIGCVTIIVKSIASICRFDVLCLYDRVDWSGSWCVRTSVCLWQGGKARNHPSRS